MPITWGRVFWSLIRLHSPAQIMQHWTVSLLPTMEYEMTKNRKGLKQQIEKNLKSEEDKTSKIPAKIQFGWIIRFLLVFFYKSMRLESISRRPTVHFRLFPVPPEYNTGKQLDSAEELRPFTRWGANTTGKGLFRSASSSRPFCLVVHSDGF